MKRWDLQLTKRSIEVAGAVCQLDRFSLYFFKLVWFKPYVCVLFDQYCIRWDSLEAYFWIVLSMRHHWMDLVFRCIRFQTLIPRVSPFSQAVQHLLRVLVKSVNKQRRQYIESELTVYQWRFAFRAWRRIWGTLQETCKEEEIKECESAIQPKIPTLVNSLQPLPSITSVRLTRSLLFEQWSLWVVNI